MIYDNKVACEDCTIAIANDDYTGMSKERAKIVRYGLNRAAGYLVVGDELGFMFRGCDVCGSGLAGDKHQVVEVR